MPLEGGKQDFPNGGDIVARAYDPDGVGLGGAFKVNAFVHSMKFLP